MSKLQEKAEMHLGRFKIWLDPNKSIGTAHDIIPAREALKKRSFEKENANTPEKANKKKKNVKN